MTIATLDAKAVSTAADLLLSAAATGVPVQPLRVTHPGMTLVDAYQIQQDVIRSRVAAGDLVRGHKIGLASLAMQQQMGVGEPDFGHLTASMFRAEPFPLQADEFMQPRVEPELAFVLGRELAGPGLSVADAVRAIDFVLPALEIVDSRIREWDIAIEDTVADNASSGAVVLGSTPTPLVGLNLPLTGCCLSRNGRVVEQGVGAAVLGSPVHALVWLANTIGAMGVGLQAGHVVLTGSFTSAVPISAGDSVTASFAGIGSIALSLAG